MVEENKYRIYVTHHDLMLYPLTDRGDLSGFFGGQSDEEQELEEPLMAIDGHETVRGIDDDQMVVPSGMILMRFTGAYDCYNHQIFEKDIVKVKRKFNINVQKDQLFEVYWNEKLLQYGLYRYSPHRSKHESADIFQLTKPKGIDLMIVGNTLQNPEMI